FTVSWASVTDATSYTLQRATDVNFLQNNVTLYIGTSTGYSQTGLADGTYYYRVKADNACGSSTWRTGPALTVTAVTELVNGQSVAVSVSKDENKYYRINVPSGATRLDIGLTNVSGDPDLYTRYNEPPTISTYECRPFAGTGISETCTTDSPSPGDWYIMIVGFSSASATLTAAVTVPCVGPAAPGSISYPSTDADGGFTVSWSASSGATGYTLQRATNANFSDAQTVYSGASTSYSQTGLASGTYYYRVNASNNCGTSTWTAGPAIVVCIPPAAPGSIIYPSVNAGGGFTVSWGSSGLAAAYTLERAGNSSFTGASTAYSGPLTSYSQTGLNPGTYYFRVNAMNQCGVSAWTAGGAARVVRNVVSALAPMLLNDTDNDGIPDDVENRTCTDVNNADTDGDGISDGVEDANKNGVVDSGETNPCDDDTDDDGLKDGVEDANKNGVLDTGETDPRTSDTDGDGLPDAWEVQYSLNPRVNDCNEDPDGDGYTNCQEYRWGSNPRDASSHPPKGIPWMNLILG
ncbi:MAG: pre-peptidase C-terminal domain-containing protein, partial [Proteobacteria bacterium]|nr:pre-peptidase C-terminal domain-containing protein [Pseudomonadota bacterium]